MDRGAGAWAIGHTLAVFAARRDRFRAGADAPPAPERIFHMLNLREYRSRADRLADHLPWAALVAPGIVLNKDGSFQKTLRFRGPDLESATQAELVSITARANNVLRRFGSGWALHIEAQRREACPIRQQLPRCRLLAGR
jgi:type IV secretory pathway VirB4 component